MASSAISMEYAEKFSRIRPLVKDLRFINDESAHEHSEEEDMLSDTTSSDEEWENKIMVQIFLKDKWKLSELKN